MLSDENVEKLVRAFRTLSAEYAEAKAQATYLEHFRKAKLAILQKKALEAGFDSVAAQDREAHADMAYVELLKGLKAAVEAEVVLRYRLEGIRLRIDLYRTQRADERTERKGYTL